MGYYSKFKIDVEPKERQDEVRQRIAIVSEYGDTYENAFDDERKWYDYREHCAAVSREFPDIVIRVHRVGEEQGDEVCAFYSNGGEQSHARGDWRPPTEPDPNGAWKEVK